MDDLCAVPNLTEESLLQDLRERFEQEQIYTYVGSILVSVNPFKFFPIYNPQYFHKYQNRKLGDPTVRPHIFAIADAAFHALVQNGINQCVVISGESGSGKTEATKMLLYHVMRLSCRSSSDHDLNRILGTAPVLEAFGNARTVSNNNSSRFGKFIQLRFLQSGAYTDATIEEYLLEKSRVISQSPEERNYHIFYFLLAGAQQKLKDKLKLTKPEDYSYLNNTVSGQEKCYKVAGIDDKDEFTKLCKAFDDVEFLPRTQEEVFTLVAALLHLGNVDFKAGEDGKSSVKNESTLEFVGQLLKVEVSTLSLSLTQRTSVIRGAEFTTPFQVGEAEDARDATAKALYSSLFEWIVAKVNQALVSKKSGKYKLHSLGLLDIFGFENFRVNSFEQLCINFANEQLQQYFNHHVFSQEQELYKSEGIDWDEVSFTDNSECLELISKRPTGILHLLDEESRLSSGTDAKLLEKINHNHKENYSFVMPRKQTRPSFILKHYAGSVTYCITNFREKNRDMLRPDVVAVLQKSRSAFILRLIGQRSQAYCRWKYICQVIHTVRFWSSIASKSSPSSNSKSTGKSAARRHTGRSTRRRMSMKRQQIVKKGGNSQEHQDEKAATPSSRKNKVVTVGGNFMVSLSSLMANLSVAEPYFVRCLKSNQGQKPMVFDNAKIMEQLHYLGMVDTIKVRRMGYSVRYPHEEFLSMVHLIVPSSIRSGLPAKENVEALLKVWNVEKRVAQTGHSKIFMRSELKDRLNSQVNEVIIKFVLVLQRRARFCLTRRRFLTIRKSVVKIQSWWRMCGFRRSFKSRLADVVHQAACATRLQAVVRGHLARKSVSILRGNKKAEKEYAATHAVGAAAAKAAAAAAAAKAAKAAAVAAAAAAAKAAVASAKSMAATLEPSAPGSGDISACESRADSPVVKAPVPSLITSKAGSSASSAGGIDASPSEVPEAKLSQRSEPPSELPVKVPLRNSPSLSSTCGSPTLRRTSFYKKLVNTDNTSDRKVVSMKGHSFYIMVFNLPTMCELCKEPIPPRLVEGGCCKDCHYAVHEECIESIVTKCKMARDASGNMVWEGTVFGASLTQLMSLHNEPVPLLLERCFDQVEKRGGSVDLYKNAPVDQTRLKALKTSLGEDQANTPLSTVDIPLICGIVKLFFRELPDPVVPYHTYRDFINATAVTDIVQQSMEVSQLMDSLPDSHQYAMKRLLHHLAVIHNKHRANTHSLAAVFAPLILSTPKTVKALESLKHVKLRLRLVENLIKTISENPEFLTDAEVWSDKYDDECESPSVFSEHEDDTSSGCGSRSATPTDLAAHSRASSVSSAASNISRTSQATKERPTNPIANKSKTNSGSLSPMLESPTPASLSVSDLRRSFNQRRASGSASPVSIDGTPDSALSTTTPDLVTSPFPSEATCESLLLKKSSEDIVSPPSSPRKLGSRLGVFQSPKKASIGLASSTGRASIHENHADSVVKGSCDNTAADSMSGEHEVKHSRTKTNVAALSGKFSSLNVLQSASDESVHNEQATQASGSACKVSGLSEMFEHKKSSDPSQPSKVDCPTSPSKAGMSRSRGLPSVANAVSNSSLFSESSSDTTEKAAKVSGLSEMFEHKKSSDPSQPSKVDCPTSPSKAGMSRSRGLPSVANAVSNSSLFSESSSDTTEKAAKVSGLSEMFEHKKSSDPSQPSKVDCPTSPSKAGMSRSRGLPSVSMSTSSRSLPDENSTETSDNVRVSGMSEMFESKQHSEAPQSSSKVPPSPSKSFVSTSPGAHGKRNRSHTVSALSGNVGEQQGSVKQSSTVDSDVKACSSDILIDEPSTTAARRTSQIGVDEEVEAINFRTPGSPIKLLCERSDSSSNSSSPVANQVEIPKLQSAACSATIPDPTLSSPSSTSTSNVTEDPSSVFQSASLSSIPVSDGEPGPAVENESETITPLSVSEAEIATTPGQSASALGFDFDTVMPACGLLDTHLAKTRASPRRRRLPSKSHLKNVLQVEDD